MYSSQAVVAQPLIPALRRQRQAELCESEDSLAYRVSSRTAQGCYTEKPCLKKTNKQKKCYIFLYNTHMPLYVSFFIFIDSQKILLCT